MVDSAAFWVALFFGVLGYGVVPAAWRAAYRATISLAVLTSLAPAATAALVAWGTAVWWASKRFRGHAWTVTALVLSLLGWLAVFKYVPVVLGPWLPHEIERRLVLPIGVSYYSFKLVHYTIEAGRGRLREHRWVDVLDWLSLFPAFTAGPIQRFDQFAEVAESAEDRIAAGGTRVVVGLVKKFFVADVFVAAALGTPDLSLEARVASFSMLDAWWFVSWSFVYAYLDFSAYSDLAVGGGRLFGVRLVENFDWPLLATDLATFWKRWHISLAGFCQAYVYMPLIGATRRPYLATYATFLAMGLWHGAAWSWVFWGLWHASGVAAALTFNRWRRRRGPPVKPTGVRAWVGVVPTFLFVAAANAFTTTAHEGGLLGLRLLLRLVGI